MYKRSVQELNLSTRNEVNQRALYGDIHFSCPGISIKVTTICFATVCTIWLQGKLFLLFHVYYYYFNCILTIICAAFLTLLFCRLGFLWPWRSYFWRVCIDGSPLAYCEAARQNHPMIHKKRSLRNQVIWTDFSTFSRKVLASFSTSSLALQLALLIQK